MLHLKPKILVEDTFWGIAALSVVLGLVTIGIAPQLSRQERTMMTVASLVGLFASLGGLVLVRFLWQRLRKKTCQQVFSAWRVKLQAKKSPTLAVAHLLSEGALRVLAMQLFAQSGYGVLNKDDDAGAIRLLDPEGSLELVICKQQSSPIEIQTIDEFHTELKRAGAVQGYLWATSGFTMAALHWARQKPIILVDQHGIESFMDCVRETTR